MSIELFTGTPGSGKSLDAARMARRYLKTFKSDVVANYELNVDKDWKGNYWYVPNQYLTPDCLIQIAEYYYQSHKFEENGILIIIDEAQLLWNSRLWSTDPNRMKWLELFSQHRKYGMKIILVCQSDIMIDKQFRTLVEFEVHHRRIGNFGFLGKLVRTLCFGELFYACKYYYGMREKVDGYLFRYSKKIGAMYNTYTTFKQLQGVPQGATQQLR